jgi:hypothetical protein
VKVLPGNRKVHRVGAPGVRAAGSFGGCVGEIFTSLRYYLSSLSKNIAVVELVEVLKTGAQHLDE